MSTVSIGSHLRGAKKRTLTYLADSLYGNGVVFVHVPKCAGTSVENALRGLYRFSRVVIHPEISFTAASLGAANEMSRHDLLNRASRFRQMLLPYHLATGVKCITGHAPLAQGVIDSYRSSHRFVTVLRDPVERFISHYSFSYKSRHHGRIDEPLQAFLDTPRAQATGVLFLEYFSETVPGERYEFATAIQKAKENLEKMAVVGFVEELDRFALDVSRCLGRGLRIGHSNKTRDRNLSGHIEVGPEQRRRIEELCAPDIEIYHWARSRFAAAARPDQSAKQSLQS